LQQQQQLYSEQFLLGNGTGGIAGKTYYTIVAKQQQQQQADVYLSLYVCYPAAAVFCVQ
jgi:hypothetical protein